MDETTAILPNNWKQRLIRIQNPNTQNAIGWCLEVHDLAISKLAAGREKDMEFVQTLLQQKLVRAEELQKRITETRIDRISPDILKARLGRVTRSTTDPSF